MTWPASDVNTTNVDATGDSPALARGDFLDLIQKFNQMRNHASAFIQTLLDDVSAVAARATLGAAVSAANDDITSMSVLTSVNNGPLGGFRNRFINGRMVFDRRAVSVGGTYTIAPGQFVNLVERWYGYTNNGTATGVQVAGSGDSQYRFQLTGGAGITKLAFGQRIESANVVDFQNKTVTVSLELANSLLTTVNWTAYYANSGDNFGTYGSPTKTSIASGSWTITGSIAKYVAQIAVPAAAAGCAIEFEVNVGAQTSGTFTIGEAQIELGSVATKFEARPTVLEQLLCERYYPAILASGASQDFLMGSAFATNVVYAFLRFRVPVFKIPTGVSWGNNTISAGYVGGTVVVNTWAIRGGGHVDGITLQGTAGSSPFTAGQGIYLFFNSSGGSLRVDGCEMQ